MKNNEMLNSNMDITEIMMTMSEGNPGALNVLMMMMSDPRSFLDILLCDSLGIRGSKLYMLHNDCCGRDNDKFARTLMMLRDGKFSSEEISKNLELIRAIPFIDDSIVIDVVPAYGEEFGPIDSLWNEYCLAHSESFKERLEAICGKGM